MCPASGPRADPQPNDNAILVGTHLVGRALQDPLPLDGHRRQVKGGQLVQMEPTGALTLRERVRVRGCGRPAITLHPHTQSAVYAPSP